MKNKLFLSSWLGAINFYILQWFFIRLTKHTEKVIESFKLTEIGITPGGSYIAGRGKAITYQWYSIQRWILPCTGWKTEYMFLGKKPKFTRLTKNKAVDLKYEYSTTIL